MARGQPSLLDPIEDRIGEAQQAERIGNGHPRFADTISYLVLREGNSSISRL